MEEHKHLPAQPSEAVHTTQADDRNVHVRKDIPPDLYANDDIYDCLRYDSACLTCKHWTGCLCIADPAVCRYEHNS